MIPTPAAVASLLPAKGKGKALPPAPPPAPLKGKGKGKAPPPPPGAALPAPAKGKGKAGKGTAKGKGKAPLPLATPAAGKSKGKGKLPSSRIHTVPVPEGLRAPAAQRIQVPALRPFAGSIWEELKPWDAAGADVLEGLSINFERLLDQWTQAPQAAPAPAPLDRLFLDCKQMQNLEVAVRGTGLTADLVRRGLTENFDLLTREQAEVLSCVVSPIHAETRGLLQVLVDRVGAAHLRDTEALLWAVENVPHAPLLSQCAAARFTVPESVDFACNPVHEIEELLGELAASRALRTVLQACLVSANMLSQTGNVRLRIDMLPGLRLRKLQPNAPSILTLVADDLQKAHDTRCRLRFLRLLAVGKCTIQSHAKKLVWQYLDDLQESPWDAVVVLEKCKRQDLTAFSQTLQSEKASCFRLIAASRLSAAGVASQSCISQQLESLSASAQQAVTDMQDCEQRLPEIADALLHLFGHESSRTVFESATEMLQHLAFLGSCLEQEKQAIDRVARRRCPKNYAWQRGGKWGTWTTVPTDDMILSRTNDPDVIRSLRASAQDDFAESTDSDWVLLGGNSSGSSKRNPGNAIISSKALGEHHHLLHGGPDGEYERCELTGKWVPCGMAAAIAERDRGTRGATAGFFVTY